MVHGGRTDVAHRAYPGAPQPWIDLSTGLNPFSYPMPTLTTSDWAALPDQQALADLEEAAALAFGVPQEVLTALPGSEVGIRMLASLDLPQPVRIVGPCYSTYEDAWPAARLIGAAEAGSELGFGSLVVANPNNPDGRCWAAAELLDLAARLALKGGFLIVDEAFVDVAPELSLCRYIPGRPNIAVLRSFGKFFGLGGVRLGFLISSVELRSAVRRRLGAWPVCTAAIRVGSQAYKDRAWIGKTIREVSAATVRLDQMLQWHGFSVRGDCPLFRLVETRDASRLFTKLVRHGILTRPFSYNPDWLRIGLPGDESAWNRFEAALAGPMGNDHD